MKNFEWTPRYSLTDEPDDSGRWARICTYKDLSIAWVKMVEYDGKRFYTISGSFPINENDMSEYCERADTFEEAKKMVENEFIRFLKHIERPYPTNNKWFFLSIRKLDDCLFGRRLGFNGSKVGKYSIMLKLFGKTIC